MTLHPINDRSNNIDDAIITYLNGPPKYPYEVLDADGVRHNTPLCEAITPPWRLVGKEEALCGGESKCRCLY